MIALPFVAIDVLLVVFFTIAAALAIALIMKKIGSVASVIPGVGGAINSLLDRTAQAVTNACGVLLSGTEKVVGGAWHWVARHFDALFNQFVEHAQAIKHLADIVANSIYSVSGLRAIVHGLQHAFHGIEQGVKTLERDFHGIERDVRTLEHSVAQGIGHDVLPRLHDLEREWGRFKGKVLPQIEADIGALGSDVSTAERWVAKNFVSDAELATEATAAAILAAAGVSWLRCSSNPFNRNPNACGLWGDLANLLAIAAIPLEIATLYELIGVAQKVTEDVTKGVEDLLQV